MLYFKSSSIEKIVISSVKNRYYPQNPTSQCRISFSSQMVTCVTKMWHISFISILLSSSRHSVTPLSSHYEYCFVTRPQMTLKCSILMILMWLSFGGAIVKSSCALHFVVWPNNENAKSHCISHDDRHWKTLLWSHHKFWSYKINLLCNNLWLHQKLSRWLYTNGPEMTIPWES